MNVVKIIGGIGNQMYQYAFGRVLQEQGKSVAYDISWYKSKTANHPLYPRKFRLPLFEITNTNFEYFYKDNPTIKEVSVGFNPNIFNKVQDCNFEGYWQYYLYYQKYLSILRKEFQLKEEHKSNTFLQLEKEITTTDSVSVHVRRGDYQLHRVGRFRDLSAKYYFTALQRVKGDLFIFSDDIPWCKDIFNPDYFSNKVTFVELPDFESFELMKKCKHNITTNSTFSWWAAFLNDNPNKIVVCPYHWLGDKGGQELRYPSEWIKSEDYVTY